MTLLKINLIHYKDKPEEKVNQMDSEHAEEKLRVQVAARSCRYGNTEAKRD